ncbi:hypothetical protein CRG98_042134 [Punica granatum]|uniref:Uncharacterized protein n=1 Tax=Punica granatum TaxID=22663 RepID=A0A2I0I0J5_PUNGR|nr:hypothetical protein CRG98_042134 [Punica granatum]
MLSKTAWALTFNSNSLASRVMKAKYGSPLAPSQRTPASTSSIWKGLLWCRNTLLVGTCFSIGNGSSTSAWHDPWILGNPSFKPIPSIGIQAEPDTKVCDLMLFHPKRWNTPLLLNLFDQGTKIKKYLRKKGEFSSAKLFNAIHMVAAVPDSPPPNTPSGAPDTEPNGSPHTPYLSPKPPTHRGDTAPKKLKFKIIFNIPDNLAALAPDFDLQSDIEDGAVAQTSPQSPLASVYDRELKNPSDLDLCSGPLLEGKAQKDGPEEEAEGSPSQLGRAWDFTGQQSSPMDSLYLGITSSQAHDYSPTGPIYPAHYLPNFPFPLANAVFYNPLTRKRKIEFPTKELDALLTYPTAFAASDALSQNTTPVSHHCLILSPIRDLANVKRKQAVSLKSGTSYTLMLHGPQKTLPLQELEANQTCPYHTHGFLKQKRLLLCKLKPEQSCSQSPWRLTKDGERFGLGRMPYC